jgi:hypothetical protein
MCKFLTAIAVNALLFCVLPMSFSLAEDPSSKTVTTPGGISPTQQAIERNSAVVVSGSNQGNINSFGEGASQQPNGAAFSFPSAEAPDERSANIPVEVDMHLFTVSVDALQMALKQEGIAANFPVNHPLMLQLSDSHAANLLSVLSQNPGFKSSAFPAMLRLQGNPAEVEFYNNGDKDNNKLQIQLTPRRVENNSILAELRCSSSKPGDNGGKYVTHTAVRMNVTPNIETLLSIYGAQDLTTYAIVKLTPKF